MSEETIQENLSLTGILKWLEETYKVKKTGEPFSLQDAQGYLRRGYIPKYLGSVLIEKMDNKYNKLYKLVVGIGEVNLNFVIEESKKLTEIEKQRKEEKRRLTLFVEGKTKEDDSLGFIVDN